MSARSDDLIWKNPNYPNQTTLDEDILLVVREDIILLIIKAIGLYMIFFALLVVRVLITGFTDTFAISIYDAMLYSVAGLLTVLFLVIFHNYYLSIQIITSERIIDIDQVSLFRREINSTPLEKIEDVTQKKKTVFNLLFNFGEVLVQTSGRSGYEETEGGSGGFVFNNVPDPSRVAHLIETLIQERQRGDEVRVSKLQAKELQKILSKRTLQ